MIESALRMNSDTHKWLISICTRVNKQLPLLNHPLRKAFFVAQLWLKTNPNRYECDQFHLRISTDQRCADVNSHLQSNGFCQSLNKCTCVGMVFPRLRQTFAANNWPLLVFVTIRNVQCSTLRLPPMNLFLASCSIRRDGKKRTFIRHALFPFSFSFLFVYRRQWKEKRREKKRGREKSLEENESICPYQSFSTRNPKQSLQLTSSIIGWSETRPRTGMKVPRSRRSKGEVAALTVCLCRLSSLHLLSRLTHDLS